MSSRVATAKPRGRRHWSPQRMVNTVGDFRAEAVRKKPARQRMRASMRTSDGGGASMRRREAAGGEPEGVGGAVDAACEGVGIWLTINPRRELNAAGLASAVRERKAWSARAQRSSRQATAVMQSSRRPAAVAEVGETPSRSMTTREMAPNARSNAATTSACESAAASAMPLSPWTAARSSAIRALICTASSCAALAVAAGLRRSPTSGFISAVPCPAACAAADAASEERICSRFADSRIFASNPGTARHVSLSRPRRTSREDVINSEDTALSVWKTSRPRAGPGILGARLACEVRERGRMRFTGRMEWRICTLSLQAGSYG